MNNKKKFSSQEKKERDRAFEGDGRIDLKKIAETEQNEKRQNVLKLLFKGPKRSGGHENTDERPIVDLQAKKLSERFALVCNVLWIFLIVFVVIILTFFGDRITTTGMQRVFRDMLSGAESGGITSDYFFSINDNAVFDSLSGVPIVAGSDRVIIFAPDGTHEYSEESQYELPRIESSENYAVVYDRAGNSFGLYDSFGIRYLEDEGNDIYCASVADNGSFAVARHGSDYTSEIKIYGPDLGVRNLIKKNNRVAAIDMNRQTGELALLTYSVSYDGRVESELMLLEYEKDSPKKIITLNEGMPLECRYLENGNISVLFEDCFTVLDGSGNIISSCNVDYGEMYLYTLSDTGVLAYFKRVPDNSEKFTAHFIKLSSETMKHSEIKVDTGAVGLNISGDKAYIITVSSIISVDMEDTKNNKVYRSDKKIHSFIVISDKTYVCLADAIKEIEIK